MFKERFACGTNLKMHSVSSCHMPVCVAEQRLSMVVRHQKHNKATNHRLVSLSSTVTEPKKKKKERKKTYGLCPCH
jgi:hypothetical protein